MPGITWNYKFSKKDYGIQRSENGLLKNHFGYSKHILISKSCMMSKKLKTLLIFTSTSYKKTYLIMLTSQWKLKLK